MTNPSGLFYQDLNLDGSAIIKSIDKKLWTSITDSANSRKTQQFGYKYDYTSRKLNPKKRIFLILFFPFKKFLLIDASLWD